MNICFSWESAVLQNNARGDIIQVKEMLKGIAEHGHQVHLVCLNPGKLKKIGNAFVHRAAAVAKISREAQLVRHIIRLNQSVNFDVLHFRSQNLVLEAKKVLPNKPCFYTMTPHYFATKNKLDFVKEQRVINACDKIFIFSENWKKYYTNTFKIPPKKIEVVGVSVDGDLFKPAQAMKEIANPVVIGYFGGIRENYGLEQILRAISILNSRNSMKYILLIAGTGTDIYIKKLSVLIKNLGIRSYVKFLGYVDRVNVPKYLVQCDVAVNLRVDTSPDKKRGFNLSIPIKVVEYMMAGIPVIASRDGGMVELLGQDYPFLVNPNRAEEIVLSIINATSNRELAALIREKNLHLAKKFSKLNIINQYISAFESVLKERAR